MLEKSRFIVNYNSRFFDILLNGTPNIFAISSKEFLSTITFYDRLDTAKLMKIKINFIFPKLIDELLL